MKIIWKLIKDNWLAILIFIIAIAFSVGLELLDFFVKGSVLKHILGW